MKQRKIICGEIRNLTMYRMAGGGKGYRCTLWPYQIKRKNLLLRAIAGLWEALGTIGKRKVSPNTRKWGTV